MSYDIIGDIHGQGGKLRALLGELGYRVKDGAYRHPEGRKAAFLGDLVDRGPEQVAVVDTVRRMIDAGSAVCIMGNHEWNAIGYATRDPEGAGYLRPRDRKMDHDHGEFLRQVGLDSALHREITDWLRTLPPVLDLGGIRLCHAWWDESGVAALQAALGTEGRLTEDFLVESFRRGGDSWKAMNRVTKGCEVVLPEGLSFKDPGGTERKEIRVRWWDGSARNYRQAALVPESERARIPDAPLPADVSLGSTSPVPVFVGHYWLSGKPGIQGPKMAVLDYSAGKNGPLVAYRWDGEAILSDDKLVCAGGPSS